MGDFALALGGACITGGLALGPPIAVCLLRRAWKSAGFLASVLALFLLDIALVYAPLLAGLKGMQWAWSGKLLEVAAFTVVAWRFGFEAAGFRRPRGSWIRITLVAVLLVTLPTVIGGSGAPQLPKLSRALYQLTMPGLAEELVYRGVLLASIDRAFTRTWSFLGVRWGMGAVVTSVLFYFAHALQLGEDGVQIAWSQAPDFLLFGFTLCWLRYRTDSFLPAIVAHNLHNCIAIFLE